MSEVNPRSRTRPRYTNEHREKIHRVLDRKVMVGADHECWNWMGARLPKGYGSLKYYADGRTHTVYAHRAAFERANGFLPRVVRHACDNPSCCNPTHLLAGNQKDNVRDMIERGRARHPRGTEHVLAKLTNEQVIEIRFSEGKHKEIASLYGIDKSIVTRIKSGAAWSHVPGVLPSPNDFPNAGELNPRAKLTREQVEEIRVATGRQADIAKRYGVTQTAVSRIKTGRGWRI